MSVRAPGVTPARRAALEASLAVERGAFLDAAFAAAAGPLPPRERAFLHEMLLGTYRLRGRLDHVLERRVKGGLDRLDPPVRALLRLGAYELLCMDGTPDYAAISQAVEQAKATSGRGAGGLVNAVLRRVAEAGLDEGGFPAFEEDPVGWLSTWGSHPRWWVERWVGRWGADAVRELVERNNRPAPVVLVPRDGDAPAAAQALAAAGWDARPLEGGLPGVELGRGVPPGAALEVVPGWIQDPAAALVAGWVGAPAGAVVADLCAAPGGKALALARRAGTLVAADRSEVRMRVLRENVARVGGGVEAVVADARRPPLRPVDAVLVDVPCTGTGTLGRHPDGRWRLGPGDLASLVRLQAAILDGAAGAVRPGGLLVYATCSLEPEENREQVEAFLARTPSFRLEPPAPAPQVPASPDGYLEVLPWTSGTDGAFAARMRRAG